MKIQVQTNFPDVQRTLDRMRTEVADKAMARALNRTIEQARTQMSREIRAEFAIPAAQVRDRLRIKRASFKGGVLGLQAALESPSAKGRSLNVIAFSARQTRAGVTVRIRKAAGRRLIRHAFIGNKGRTVFTRLPDTTMRSRKRYAGTKHAEQLQPVRTIDVPQMFNARRINDAVVRAMLARFPAIFEREARFAIAQAGAAQP